MKIPHLSAVICLVVMCAGCNKWKKIDMNDYPVYIGNFDYAYSVSGSEYVDYKTVGRYGVTVKSNGKVLFFQDGKLKAKGEIERVSSTNDGLYLEVEKKGHVLKWNGKDLEVSYPSTGKINHYFKVKS